MRLLRRIRDKWFNSKKSQVQDAELRSFIKEYWITQFGIDPYDEKNCIEKDMKGPRKSPVVVKPPTAAPVQKNIDWFIADNIPKPSPAEQKIIDELERYNIEWYREVSFREFKSSDHGYYRFDFYIPSKRLIIEYDGKDWHKSDRASIDTIKEQWCKEHGITVKRFCNKHYYQMDIHIGKLMKDYRIFPK